MKVGTVYFILANPPPDTEAIEQTRKTLNQEHQRIEYRRKLFLILGMMFLTITLALNGVLWSLGYVSGDIALAIASFFVCIIGLSKGLASNSIRIIVISCIPLYFVFIPALISIFNPIPILILLPIIFIIVNIIAIVFAVVITTCWNTLVFASLFCNLQLELLHACSSEKKQLIDNYCQYYRVLASYQQQVATMARPLTVAEYKLIETYVTDQTAEPALDMNQAILPIPLKVLRKNYRKLAIPQSTRNKTSAG